MQKIVYVPPYATYGDENNAVLGTDDYILSTVSGVSGTEISLITSDVVGQDGTYVQDIHVEPREIPCTVYVQGKTRSQMYANRFKLIKLLAPTKQPGTVYYSNDYITVKIDAYPILPADFTERIKNYNKCDIKLYAPYPHWQDIEDTTINIAYQDGVGFKLPFVMSPAKPITFATINNTATINYTGSIPVGVTIEIVAVTDLDAPCICNITTGQQILLDRYMDINNRLTLTTIPGRKSVTLTAPNAAPVDAFQFIDPTSTFWQLLPGKNVIQYITKNATEKAQVYITYSTLHMGV